MPQRCFHSVSTVRVCVSEVCVQNDSDAFSSASAACVCEREVHMQRVRFTGYKARRPPVPAGRVVRCYETWRTKATQRVPHPV